MKGAKEAGGEECICVLQLTEAGDVFYQILQPEQSDSDTPRPSATEDEPLLQHTARSLLTPTLTEATAPERKPAEQLAPDSQLDVEDTWSDDGIIGPTQDVTVPRFVAETPEREQPVIYSDSDDSDSEGKGRRLKHSGLQVVVNDEPELDHMSEMDAGEQGGQGVRGKDAAAAEEPSSVGETEVRLSNGALITWKHWLQKLMEKSCEKKPRPRCPKHLTVSTKGFLYLPDGDTRDSTEEEHVQSLRRDLRTYMSNRSLLVHSTTSTCRRAPDVESLPNPVDTEAWRDQLSQRLTQSWQGKSAWRAWWEEELGLNREEKVKALKRKRRREKQAKRASGQGLELSGSFTSSVSHLSDLDSFSDSAGWSSAASQGWSDTEGSGPLSQLGSFLEVETPRATTPPTLEDDTPVSTVIATPRNVNNRQANQLTPCNTSILSLSQTVKPDSTPASQRRHKKPEDPLRSVFAPQDEPLREENNPPPPASLPSSSQCHSSQSVPLRTLRVDLSQDFLAWSGFSQSPSVSQSSKGRLGSSQASQTKKKRSRMGF
ncbi:hypothetical protein INR49_030307 [Caranx melampygus]|nr:hypothetical protein INR49_030307 [Caranx melampygus]